MSQSAILYRISVDKFLQLANSGNNHQFHISSSKDPATFQGSFMGLEFVLFKGIDESTTEQIREVFNTGLSIGAKDFNRLTAKGQLACNENGGSIAYLDIISISKLKGFLDKVLEANIELKYDPIELNENGIYQKVRHNYNSPDQAYNLQHILDDLKGLKAIIH